MKSSHKRLLSLCLSLALLLILFPASQAEAAIRDPSEYLTYTIADGAVTITGCDKNITGHLLIPDTIEGLPVTTIGVSAFNTHNGTYLTYLTIPASVISVQSYAFACSTLKAITFLGDPPTFESDPFGDEHDYWGSGFFGTPYYPMHNPKWTPDVMPEYYYADADGRLRIRWVGVHSWDNGTPIVAATCTSGGESIYKCTGCDETETRTVAALGHSDKLVLEDATCTEPGRLVYTCTVCGDVRTTEVAAATGHQFGAGVWVTQPSCQEAGQKSYTCSDCGFVKYVNVAANGHDEVITPAVPATCTTSGLTESSHCSTCGEILTAQEVIPATGHSYESVVNTPTCTEDGSITNTCTTCGDTIIGIVPATGHQFENGSCTHCGEAEVVVVPGDASGDGKVNMADVSKVFAHVRNKNKLTDECALLCADTTGDGNINMADVARIFAHARGKNPLF